jgi:hypothetical protein
MYMVPENEKQWYSGIVMHFAEWICNKVYINMVLTYVLSHLPDEKYF